jgi:23S rRNA (uracil1939-C5)-methyltransferase
LLPCSGPIDCVANLDDFGQKERDMKVPFKVRITDLARGGAGIARRDDGIVVFVPKSIPGDFIEVLDWKVEKRYWEANQHNLVEPSLQRVPPPCPVFESCGGCMWQMAPYSLQWETKWKGAIYALEKRNVKLLKGPELFPAEKPYHYRNRIQLRALGRDVGFYARKSHEIVPIQKCWIAEEPLNHALDEIRKSLLSHPALKETKYELTLLPSGEIKTDINQRTAASGFHQVNTELNQVMTEWIHQHLKLNEELLDLFGGSGNLSQGVMNRYQRIDCVDLNVPQNDLAPHFHFHKKDSAKWIQKFHPSSHVLRGRSAILDPPREGLHDQFQAFEKNLRRLDVKELILVGCDVDSWARDVSWFVSAGWQISDTAIFDFFPQTPHFESVSRLIV